MLINQTKLFAQQKKTLQRDEINFLDAVVKKLSLKPLRSGKKLRDLSDIRTYEFYIKNKAYLFSYYYIEGKITLLQIGIS